MAKKATVKDVDEEAAAASVEEAAQRVADAKAVLDEATKEHADAVAAHAEMTKEPPPVYGEDVLLHDDSGNHSKVKVPADWGTGDGFAHQRVLTIAGRQYEHTSDVQTPTGTVWVYRQHGR